MHTKFYKGWPDDTGQNSYFRVAHNNAFKLMLHQHEATTYERTSGKWLFLHMQRSVSNVHDPLNTERDV